MEFKECNVPQPTKKPELLLQKEKLHTHKSWLDFKILTPTLYISLTQGHHPWTLCPCPAGLGNTPSCFGSPTFQITQGAAGSPQLRPGVWEAMGLASEDTGSQRCHTKRPLGRRALSRVLVTH